ncbi:MAG: DUF1552 domain-containing protein [Myxococcota bacterium]
MSQKRRDFLRHAALGGLLAPIAAYFPEIPEARAMDDRTHLVLVFLPNGKVQENPFLGAGNTPVFEDGFRPYQPFADRCIAFREYGFQAFISREYEGDHGGHIAPGMVMFTGDVPHSVGGAGQAGRAPSIDQIVAWDYLRRDVITNPLRASLNIKMTGSSFRIGSQFVAAPSDYSLGRTYNRELAGVSQLGQPQQGFELLFGDLAGVNRGATVDELWAYGQSVLDVPAAELQSIRSQLPVEGARLVDEHLDALRDLERSLEDDGSGETITPPDPPGEMNTSDTNHVAVFESWADLIDVAFRLDRTRIATVQFGGIASRFQVPDLGLGFVGNRGDSNSGTDHHSYTHWRGAEVPAFMNWYAERVASLLGRLQGDGSRADMLASSALMVGMEFGRNHNARDVPVTIFGECGGYFDTGKVVTYGNDLEHFRLHTGTLLALGRAMGVAELETVGHQGADYQNGVPAALRE